MVLSKLRGAGPIQPFSFNRGHIRFEDTTCPVGVEAALSFSEGARLTCVLYGQSFSDTTRLPSVTLSDIGYYTDDGAYYYVWGGGGKNPPHDPD